MKSIIFLGILCFSTLISAQSKYENAMTKALTQFENAKTVDELNACTALFERIADSEKDKWLPYYYAALSNNMISWVDQKADKDLLAEKSIVLIEKAEAIEANNAELFCLRNMVASSQMMVDPMNRWQKYGMLAGQALENAKKADPNNPRIYYLEAQGIYNTPEAFGGGKKNAKPLFEKAVQLFNTYVDPSALHPKWGKEEANNLLIECSK